jgi:hypothetical protein
VPGVQGTGYAARGDAVNVPYGESRSFGSSPGFWAAVQGHWGVWLQPAVASGILTKAWASLQGGDGCRNVKVFLASAATVGTLGHRLGAQAATSELPEKVSYPRSATEAFGEAGYGALGMMLWRDGTCDAVCFGVRALSN